MYMQTGAFILVMKRGIIGLTNFFKERVWFWGDE